MPIFKCIQDPLTLKEISKIDLPLGSTPNDFKKILMGENNFPFPTICSIEKKGCDKIYLSRSEWDFAIQNDEVCSFMFHPQAEGGAAVIVSLVISIVIGVGTYLLTPRPNLNLNQKDKGVSPTYDLTSQGNKARVNQPIPIHYGTIRCYPDVVCLPYTKAVYPAYNYYRVGLCVGQGEIDVSDIQIDDTDLSKFAWIRSWISSGSPIPINEFEKPMITSKEVKNVELITTNAAIQGLYYAYVASDENIDITSPGANIDGLAMGLDFDVLLFKQTDNTQNGVWTWKSATTSMVRVSYMNDPAEFINAVVSIQTGTYDGQDFVQVNQIDKVGKDPIEFEYYDATDGVGDYYILNDANDISKVKTIFLDFSCFQGVYTTNNAFVTKLAADFGCASNVTISAPGNGPLMNQSIGGPYVNDTYLLFGQTDPAENGKWIFNGAAVPMTRVVDLDSASEFTDAQVDVIFGVQQGTYICTTVVTTLGTDPIVFAVYDSSSSFYTYSIGLIAYIQPIDYLGANVGSPVTQTFYINGSSNQPIYQTISYEHPTAERFKVKVLRLNSARYKTDIKYMDLVQWSGLRGEFDSVPVYDNKTFLVIEAKATGKLNDSNIGIFNCLGKRKLYVYDFDTTTWAIEQSNSPLWAFWDLATNGRGLYDYGIGLDEDTQLDLGNLEDINDIIENEGYECNARFDTAISGEEALAQIAQAMKCIVYKRGGKRLLAHDGVKATLQGFYTRTNTDSVSVDFFTKNEFSATWFKVTYWDEDTNKKETVDCIIAGESTETGNVEEIELHTITNRLQAWKYGQYLCAQSRYHNTKVKFQTDTEGFLPNPLDHISFCHPLLTPENQHGYVQKVDGAVVYLSEPIDFSSYASGLISFKNKNGSAAGPYICSPLDTDYKVQLVPFDTNAEDYTLFSFHTQEDQNSFEPTEFTFGVANSSEILVVKSITPNGSNSANIEAVIRDNRVYTAGLDYHNMPDYDDDTSVAQWYPYFLQAISFTSNIFTKENILDFNGNGYYEFKLSYLYDDGGTEEIDLNTVTGINTAVTPTSFNHTYTHTYSAPPSRVTITPRIWVIDSTYRDLTELAIIVPIQLVE